MIAHKFPVICSSISRSGDIASIITVGQDGYCFKWKFNTKTRKLLQFDQSLNAEKFIIKINEQSSFKISRAVFSDSSETLALGFSNGTYGVFETRSMAPLNVVAVSQSPVGGLSFLNSSEYVAVGSAPDASKSLPGNLAIWNWKSDTFIFKQIQHEAKSKARSIMAIGLSDNMKFVATAGSDGKVLIWDFSTRICLAVVGVETSPVVSVKFTKKNNFLAYATCDGHVLVYDIIRFKKYRSFQAPNGAKISAIEIDNTGERLFALDSTSGEIILWSVHQGSILDITTCHTGKIHGISYDSARQRLASYSSDFPQ